MAKRQTHMDRDMRDYADQVIRHVCLVTASKNTPQVAAAYLRVLEQESANGNDVAIRLLHVYLEAGTQAEVNNYWRRTKRTPIITHTGEQTTFGGRRGVRQKHTDGTLSTIFQHTMWDEMDWPEYVTQLDDLAAQRDTLDTTVEGMRKLLYLRDLHPDLTVGNAMRAEGLDPASYIFDAR